MSITRRGLLGASIDVKRIVEDSEAMHVELHCPLAWCGIERCICIRIKKKKKVYLL